MDLTVEGYAGIRRIELVVHGYTFHHTFPGPWRAEVDTTDPVVGLGASRPLTDSLRVYARGDYGGFERASDYTFQLIGGASWRFRDAFSIDLEYRYHGFRHPPAGANPQNFNHYTTTRGPVLAMSYWF